MCERDRDTREWHTKSETVFSTEDLRSYTVTFTNALSKLLLFNQRFKYLTLREWSV